MDDEQQLDSLAAALVAATGAEPGGIQGLVARLRASSPAPNLLAALRHAQLITALCVAVQESSDSRRVLLEAGGIEVLVQNVFADPNAGRGIAAALRTLAAAGTEFSEAIAAAGGIPALVELLRRGPSNKAKEVAAMALYELAACCPGHARAIVEAGGVRPLAALAQAACAPPSAGCQLARPEHAQVAVAGVLYCAVGDAGAADNVKAAVAAGGGTAALVRLLCSSSNSSIQQLAGQALLGLVRSCPAAEHMLVHCVPALVQLLCDGSSSTAEQQCAAVHALANAMVSDSPHVAAAVAAAGGVAAVVHRLRASSFPGVQQGAAAALANFTLDRPGCDDLKAAVVAAGGVEALLGRLRNSTDAVEQVAAAATLRHLSMDSPARQRAIVASGGTPCLLDRLLSSPSSELQEPLVAALCDLSMNSSDCRASIAASALPMLVGLLVSGDSSSVTQLGATVILLRLSTSGFSCRQRVVAAGGVAALEQLLRESQDHEVRQSTADALRGLSARRFSSLFPVPGSWLQESASGAQPGSVAAAEEEAGSPAMVAAEREMWAALPAPRVCAAHGCTSTDKLRRCCGCGAVRYCSEACQGAHWRAHKADCRRAKASLAAGTEA